MTLPEPGTAFLVPVDKQRNTFVWATGVVEILKHGNGKLVPQYGIACSRWLGPGVPTGADLAAATVLSVDFGDQPARPLIVLDDKAPPRQFKRIGAVPAAVVRDSFAIAKQLSPQWYSGIKWIGFNVERQWRWEHDRAGLIAQDKADLARVTAENERDDKALAARAKQRRAATLATLAKVELLPEWEGMTTPKRRAKAEELLRELVSELRALGARGKKPTRADKLAAIERCVTRLNKWPGSAAIDTPEREALATAIDDIGHAAGLKGSDLAGPYRDW